MRQEDCLEKIKKLSKILNQADVKVLFYICLHSVFTWAQVEARTLESAPDGVVLLEVNDVSSRSLRARWTAPPRPNGNLVYTLFYKSKGSKQRLRVNKAPLGIKATLYHHPQKKMAITLGLVTPQSCRTTVKLLLLIFICGLKEQIIEA